MGLMSFFKRGIRFTKRTANELLEEKDWRNNKNVFVFGAPFHNNAGDQAQTLCIQKWMEDNYPGYAIRIFDTIKTAERDYRLLFRIKKNLKASDLIILHSGYHTTDLYKLEDYTQRKVVEMFPEKRIVILPQTIFYQDLKEQEAAQKVYNSHNNLIMMCRDEVSLKKAIELFPGCKKLLFPDIVTTMIGKYHFSFERSGILLCTRQDKESSISEKDRNELIRKLSKIDTVDLTDTNLNYSAVDFNQKRQTILEREWARYAHYRVIITDRYHGTVFSLIANTPVIVMPSADHKLESGVRWFPESFNGFVQYIPDLKQIPNRVQEIYHSDLSRPLPPYFTEVYYNKLKSILEENV